MTLCCNIKEYNYFFLTFFYKKYFNNNLCDLGQINKGTDHDFWYKPKVNIDYHLKHKFILCIEGNDVASNLKWVMSSNSVAVMPKPKYESWFMEGKLIADYHYIQIKDDYSDMEEKINFYIKNSDKLKIISKNANEYISQFKNKESEKIISILDEYIKPAVSSDGGNILFDSYDKDKKVVKVILQGACSGCPSSTVTLKNGIENMLKEMLSDKVNSVEAING